MSATEEPEYDYEDYIIAFPNVTTFKGVPTVDHGNHGIGTITSYPYDRNTLTLVSKVQLHSSLRRKDFDPHCTFDTFDGPGDRRLRKKASAHYTLTPQDGVSTRGSQLGAGIFLQAVLDGKVTLPPMAEVIVTVRDLGQQQSQSSSSPNWHGRQIWHYLTESAVTGSRNPATKPTTTISYHNPTIRDYEESLRGPYESDPLDLRKVEIGGTGSLPSLARCMESRDFVEGLRRHCHSKIHCSIDGQELPAYQLNRTAESRIAVTLVLHPPTRTSSSRGQPVLPSMYSVMGCFGGLGPGYPAVKFEAGDDSSYLESFCFDVNENIKTWRQRQSIPRPSRPIY